MDNLSWWISQKMFSYQNPDTSVIFNIVLESGIFEDAETSRNNYYPPRIAFQIYDGRIQSSRVQVELQFAEMDRLVESIDTLFTKDKKTIFQSQSVISVTRYWKKAHKTVTLLFRIKDNKAVVEVKLTDPTTGGEKVIILDWPAYNGMYNFVKQVRNSYAIISSNILTVAMQERMVEKMGILFNNMPQIKLQAYRPSIEEKDIEIDLPLSSLPDIPVNNVAANFDSSIDIDKIELDKPKDLPTEEIKEMEKSPMSFIGNFLNYDPMRLCNWVSAYLCTDEKSDSSMFNAWKSVGIGSNVSIKLNTTYWYDIQYYMNIMFRRGVKSFLEGGQTFDKFKVPSFLSLKSDEEYKMCVEIAFTCMSFMIITNSYLKKIKDETLQTNSEFMKIRIANYFLSQILMPFIVSVINKPEFSDDMFTVLNKCRKNGFIDRLEEVYGRLVAGGKFNLSDAVFTNQIKGFIKAVTNNVETFNMESGIRSICEEYKVPVFENIKDDDEIKICVLNTVLELKVDDTGRKHDGRLELFLECIKKYTDDIIVEKIKSSCTSYLELEKFLRGSNVPDEVLKIKRVMDMDKSLNRRTDIIKAIKSMLEDPAVTETRVMFDEVITENNDGVQMSEDLESVLFGTDVGI